MRPRSILIGITLISFLPDVADCQSSAPGTAPPPIRKEWVLGERVVRDLEDRDGRIDDPGVLAYLSQIEDRVATAVGSQSIDIRMTRSSDQYATLLPSGVLFLAACWNTYGVKLNWRDS